MGSILAETGGNMDQFSFIVKLVMEAGVVGGIAITVIRFLMVRIVKQMDDERDERKGDHRQSLLWMAMISKTLLSQEKMLILHDANVYGINPTAGDTPEERHENYNRQASKLFESVEQQEKKLDTVISVIEQSIAKEQYRHAAKN